MIDVAAISTTLSSINIARQMIASAIELRDSTKMLAALNKAASDLADAYDKIRDLQVAISMGDTQIATLLREKRDLEEELREKVRMQTDFDRYKLHELATGVFVYSCHESCKGTEPPHYLCTRCRNNGKKSILSRVETPSKTAHVCLEKECHAEYLEKEKTVTPIPIKTRERI